MLSESRFWKYDFSNETRFSYTGSQESLEWGIRFKVALGVAQGLLYLHLGCHRRVIHRDIKASNILLTEDYEPQVLNTISPKTSHKSFEIFLFFFSIKLVFLCTCRFPILDSLSGFRISGITMLCSPLKAPLGESYG